MLVPEPFCTYHYDNVSEIFTPWFIVFSYEQAAVVFREAPPKAMVLCVDVPRALYVTSCYEAHQFYKQNTE